MIPDGVTRIRSGTFHGCSNLSKVFLPNGITSIGEAAFEKCSSLTNIALPSSVTSIGEFAFRECTSLTSIRVPSSVTEISESTFQACTGLTYAVIPRKVEQIERAAFSGCDSITDIYYGGSSVGWANVYIGENNDILSTAKIHCESNGPGLEDKIAWGKLRNGDGCWINWWCNYQEDEDGRPLNAKIQIFTASTDATKEELYLYNDAIETGFPYPWEMEPYNIPKSAVTDLIIGGETQKLLMIPAGAFQGYSGLKRVSLSCVSTIDTGAFSGCAALYAVGLSDPSLKVIGKEAFKNTNLWVATISESVTTIGENAFDGCEHLVICCYENSVAHQYAVENNIPFDLIYKEVQIPCGNDEPEKFEHNLDYYVSQANSTTYSPQLSHMLIALSNAAYDENNIFKSMQNLGFKDSDILTHYDENWNDAIAYAIGKKTMDNGKKLVLIAVRGSSSRMDWLSNFAIATKDGRYGWHVGFSTAADEVWTGLKSLVGDDLSNTTFVVTGHSRGAATANLIEIKLFEENIPQSSVYGYNFACPDVAVALPTMWNWNGEHNNIFNINAAGDPVSVLPGVAGNALNSVQSISPGASWGKFGISRWFALEWSDLSEIRLNFDNHNQGNYLTFLKNEFPIIAYKTWEDRVATIAADEVSTALNNIKSFFIKCPVDVQIMDSSGKVIASVIDNVIDYHGSEFGEIMIFTSGDQKAILVQDNGQPLTAYLTATDSGEMEYSVQTIVPDTEEVLSEKTFENVALTAGKEMVSFVNIEETTGTGPDVSKVPLYVLDDDGNPEKEVLPDGNGTEVPIETPDNPPVSCEHEYAATVIAPTCTEQGYTTYTCGKCGDSYTDSYTAALGHSYGEWTVVIPATSTTDGQQERICSLCGNKQTSTIPATGESGTGTPDYGSSTSSDSSSTTYSITIPAAIGGTVSISPKTAAKGTVVTISVSPDSGYELASITVLDSTSKAITLTDKGNGKYTFTMPGSKVTVDAIFQPVQDDTPSATDDSWSNPFTDVANNAWYYDAVRFVNEAGLMNGTSDSVFSPDVPLSRAMLAQILYNKDGRPIVADSIFTDVVSGAWYADAVSWAAADGIVGGYGNGLFGPDDSITREQLAVMLWRHAGEPAATDKELHFNDADTASTYAIDALRWAAENGIITGYGDGILAPGGQATRAQVAQMFMNYLTK